MDRSTSLPGRGFSEILASFVDQVSALEVRAQWMNSIQQSSLTLGTTQAAGGFFSPPPYTEITSLDLNPGRWILFGQVTHRMSRIAPKAIPDIDVDFWLKVSWESDAPDAQTDERSVSQYAEAAASPNYTTVSHVTALEVLSTTPSRAALSLAARALPADSVTYVIDSVTLVAYPG